MAAEVPLPAGVLAVRDRVFVGPDAAVPEMVRSRGCVGIVSCLEELSEADRAAAAAGVRVLHYPLEDRAQAELLSGFSKVIDFISGFVDTASADAEDDDGEAAPEDGHDEAKEVPPAAGSVQPSATTHVSNGTDAQADAAVGPSADANAAPSQSSPPPAVAAAPPPQPPCIFIHCHAGTSRSVAVALAAAMTVDHLPLKEAFERLTQNGATQACPNPGFMYQLVQLDKDLHDGESTFDLADFFITSLCRLFPNATREQVTEVYTVKAAGDVGVARNVLMRQFASAFVDKDKIMIDLLTSSMAHQAIPRKVVARIYEEEGKSRDKALLRLLQLQPEQIVDLLTEA